MSSEHRSRARQAGHALDAANFFLADVRDGLGPYLAVYLLAEQHWDEARIGLVMSMATIAGIVAQTPAGALVDATRAKRTAMAAAAIMVTIASLSVPLFPSFLPVAISQGIAQAAAVVFPPAIAAVSLGIFGRAAFTRRIGRNETFNHAGNAVAAGLAGVSAYWFGPTVVFCLLGAMALASLVSILAIPRTRHRPRACPRPARNRSGCAARTAVRARRAAHVSAPARLRDLRPALSPLQRRDAAVGRAKARA
ncbi:MFS transporter [Bradyrhizobium sp. USDA 4459]